MQKIKLCAFADEYSEDFTEQLKGLNKFNIPYIELRGINGKNVSQLTVLEAVEIKKQLDDYGVKVWSIGSPIGKVSLDSPFEEHLLSLKNLLEICKVLDCDKIRVFSFFTNEYDKARSEVIRRLNAMCSLAKEYGVELYNENEKGVFGDLPERSRLLLDSVSGLKCVYDPANFVQCNADMDKAMDLLSERANYYHIKDARFSSNAVVPAGKGDGKVYEMLSKIKSLETVLTLEPHLAVFKGYDTIDKSKLVNIYAYRTSHDAFADAVKHLVELLIKLGYKQEKDSWIR